MAINPFSRLSSSLESICKCMAITGLVVYALCILFCVPFVMSAEASCLGYGYFEYGQVGLDCQRMLYFDLTTERHIGLMRFLNMDTPYAFRYTLIIWLFTGLIMIAGHILFLLGCMQENFRFMREKFCQTDKLLTLGHPIAVTLCFVGNTIASLLFLTISTEGFFPFWFIVHLPLEIVAIAASAALFFNIREDELQSSDDEDDPPK